MPAAGAGLRFKLDKKNHINYRIDWAIGRAGHTLTIDMGPFEDLLATKKHKKHKGFHKNTCAFCASLWQQIRLKGDRDSPPP